MKWYFRITIFLLNFLFLFFNLIFSSSTGCMVLTRSTTNEFVPYNLDPKKLFWKKKFDKAQIEENLNMEQH